MENLTKEINKHFKDKYEFLRLWSCVYDVQEKVCKLIFLFPETIYEITDEMRGEIEIFLKHLLSLNGKLIITYKKSFLHEDLIQKSVMTFLEKNYISISSEILQKNVEVLKQPNNVSVTLSLQKELKKYFLENKIFNDLKDYLERIYYSSFSIQINELESVETEILSKRKNFLKEEKKDKILRYKVKENVVLIGKDISPMPELISNQKDEKIGLILAGKIKNISKKTFKSKRNKNKDIDNYYYTFEINDTTGIINAIHFSSKTNEPKLDKLQEGATYLFLGDLRKNNYNKLTYYIKNISYCLFDESEIIKSKRANEEIIELKDSYQFVSPKTYVSTVQESLFDSVNDYNDFILQNNFVVFDVETTGLEPETCEIIEIGAIKIEKGKLTDTFQTLVKPKKEIPSLITDITGIDNNMVADAPSIKKVIADFVLFSKNCVLSGYNVSFDMRFLQNAGKEINYHFENQVEDTMVFARNKLFLGNYTLKNVAKHLNVSLKEAHRALNDAIATAKVLLALNKK